MALPACAWLRSLWVDLEMTGETMTTKASVAPLIQKPYLLEAASAYLNGANARTPLASPLTGFGGRFCRFEIAAIGIWRLIPVLFFALRKLGTLTAVMRNDLHRCKAKFALCRQVVLLGLLNLKWRRNPPIFFSPAIDV